MEEIKNITLKNEINEAVHILNRIKSIHSQVQMIFEHVVAPIGGEVVDKMNEQSIPSGVLFQLERFQRDQTSVLADIEQILHSLMDKIGIESTTSPVGKYDADGLKSRTIR